MPQTSIVYRVKVTDVKRARAAFEANEPRDLFYRTATELVDLAVHSKTKLSVAEALAVLLQTWNRIYYRFHKKFDKDHFLEIDRLLENHRDQLADCRSRRIENLHVADRDLVHSLFETFEDVLGPIGAAKALHLLAPNFFALWDRKIATAYDVPLNGTGSKGDHYWEFMLKSRNQCIGLVAEGFRGNPLKALDEYNYCKYSRGWIK